MSDNEHIGFERKLAFHGAPTLLGIKCANLISLSADEFDIESNSEYFNSKVVKNGLKSHVICSCLRRKLVLLYNDRLLEKCLCDEEVQNILYEYGYSSCSSVDEYIDVLSVRIRQNDIFPHEIGIFLGYPIEDVKGFIKNKGENFKICGAWKVYGNVEKARKTFERYDKCRIFLYNKLNQGIDIYQALKIS